MKLSFLIYLLLLFIDGLIALQATGSPMLLVIPMVGIVFYGALCGRLEAVPEVIRLLVSGLMITFGLMNFGNNLHVIFLTLLSLPHYLAATQCVWEMQHAESTQAAQTRDVRVSVFSMAFYASWGVAFILLQADSLRLAWLHQQLLAGTVVVLSLVGWECSRILRLKAGRTKDQLPRASYWRRVAAVLALSLLAMLGFSAFLPPVAEAISHLSPKWKPPSLDANVGPPHRPKANPLEQSGENATGLENVTDADETARSGRMRLPKRVNLNQTEVPRAYLKFSTVEQAQLVQQQGPIYLRSFALSVYDNFEWQTSSQDGFWIKDEEDGKKDGHTTVTADTAQSVAYTVFMPKADGNALLALPGLRSVDAPKIYALPDEWFQLQDTGDIRYGARSAPKIWGRFAAGRSKPANPGLNYLRVPEGRLGDALKQLKEQIFKARQAPEDCIPALQDFFAAHYTYSTKVENKNDVSPLENFLLSERKGYCDLFATSAALLLRKVGIPTRLGFGYMAGDYDPKEGLFTFRQLHAHSWVEIMLEGHGWVICEFTPPAQGAPGPGDPNVATAPNLDSFADVSDPDLLKKKTGFEAEVSQLDFFSQLGRFWPALGDRNTRLVIGLVLLGFAGLAWWKRYAAQRTPEEKARRAAAARDQQPAYVQELRALATAAGIKFNLGDTVQELRRTLQANGCDHPELTTLANYHYAVRYEDAAQDRRQESDLITFLKSLREEWRQRQAKAPKAG